MTVTETEGRRLKAEGGTSRTRKSRTIPRADRIDVWAKGDYVEASAGNGPDQWEVVVTGPVRNSPVTVKEDEQRAKHAVVAALVELRRLGR